MNDCAILLYSSLWTEEKCIPVMSLQKVPWHKPAIWKFKKVNWWSPQQFIAICRRCHCAEIFASC